MYRQQVYLISNIVILLDALVFIIAGYAAYFVLAMASDNTWWMEPMHFYLSVIFLMFFNNYVLAHLGLYSDKRLHSLFSIIKKLLFVVFMDFSALGAIAAIFNLIDVPPTFILVYGLFAFSGLLLIRLSLELYLNKAQEHGFSCRRILIVGSDKRVEKVYEGLNNQRSWGHKIVGYVKPSGRAANIQGLKELGTLDNFETILYNESIDEVVFALPPGEPKNFHTYVDLCKEMGLSIRIIPGLFEFSTKTNGLSVETIQGIPTISFQTVTINASGLFYKRILDFIGGVVGMALLASMYPIIAVAIKLDSPGPVFFKQKRVGQNGRIFRLYKFRTMYVDAEERKKELMENNEMKGLMFKMKDDPRVTRVGKFLRKTSLDEFPQFINVMRGEISLVGTRPPTPDEVSQYERWHRRRVSMKPGVTGYWQVSGRNKISDFDQVVEYDLKYIDGWRFSRDLEILFKTVWTVLRGEGAC